MKTHIRPATHDDALGIATIYNDAVVHTTASYDYEPETPEARLAWLEAHEREGLPVLVAEDADGRIVGWGALSGFRPRIGYRFTVEDSVYIAPEHCGQGLGRRLLSELIDAARAKGCHTVIAGMDSENPASIGLHAALGFAHVGRFRQVGYKFDRWLDVIFMQLLLEPE